MKLHLQVAAALDFCSSIILPSNINEWMNVQISLYPIQYLFLSIFFITCKVVYRCGFDLYSPNDKGHWTSLVVFIDHLHISCKQYLTYFFILIWSHVFVLFSYRSSLYILIVPYQIRTLQIISLILRLPLQPTNSVYYGLDVFGGETFGR